MGDYRKLIFFYLDQVWRRRWMAMIFAWTVCLLGWTLVACLPDNFASEARVYVDTQSLLNPLLKGLSVRADEGKRDQDVTIMQRTLTSRPNLVKVSQMTDLDKEAHSVSELQSLIDDLERRIVVTNQGNNLFNVKYTDNSASMAKRVVQAMLTIFVENNVGNRREDMQTARNFIETQIAEYERKLKESEKRLADFKVSNINFMTVGENFAGKLESTRVAIRNGKADLEDLVAPRSQLQAQLNTTPQFLSIDSAPQVIVGEGGTPSQQRVKALQKRIDEMRLQYTDKHPEIVRALQQLKELEDASVKADEAARVPGAVPKRSERERSEVRNELYTQLALRLSELDGKITSTRRRLQTAEADSDDLQKKSVEGPRVEAEFTALNRDYLVLKGNYESLLTRRESARIAEAADTSADSVQFRIIAEPEEPSFPTGPKRRIFNTINAILGIFAGCGFVILIAKLEDCVTMPEDLAEFGDLPVLGCISTAITLGVPEPFLKRHRQFTLAATGLVIVAVFTIAMAPNLSTLPQRIAARISS